MNAHRMSNEGVCANLGTIRELFLRATRARNEATADAEFYQNLVTDLRQDSSAYQAGWDEAKARDEANTQTFVIMPGSAVHLDSHDGQWRFMYASDRGGTPKQVTIIVEDVEDGKKPVNDSSRSNAVR